MKHYLLFFLLFCASLSYAQSNELSLKQATASSLSLAWNDNVTELKWGINPTDLDHTVSLSNTNSIVISNLEPATVYYCKLGQEPAKPFITSSLSSGEIKVFFNYSIDASFSNGASPACSSTTQLNSKMIQYILSATNTIDICMYNCNLDAYVNALKQASANGVTVRYITDAGQYNNSLNTTLNFPVLYASSTGIMHDKFLVIDRENVDSALVITGSYNFTYSNLYEGYNNMISIQDQALAEVYTMEFNEMWGSTAANPDLANSKTGNEKIDNTPHTIFVNDVKIESYFSPSDQTTSHIVDAINTADEDLRFGVLVFTNDDIEDAIFDLNVPTKGLIESQFDGTATNEFQAAGIPVYDFEETNHFLHHKYAMIDAISESSDPTVITGSHNWSYSAEYKNDENTLIIHDADITNIYLQEFEARWQTIVAITDVDQIQKIHIFPNPVDKMLQLVNNTTIPQTVSLLDCFGKSIKEWDLQPTEQVQHATQAIPNGIYFIQLNHHLCERLVVTHP